MSTANTEATSEEETRELVREIVAELAPTKGQQIEDAARLIEDLGYHSLALMELAFALEDEFQLTPLDEQTAQQITTVQLIGDHVVNELRERGSIS